MLAMCTLVNLASIDSHFISYHYQSRTIFTKSTLPMFSSFSHTPSYTTIHRIRIYHPEVETSNTWKQNKGDRKIVTHIFLATKLYYICFLRNGTTKNKEQKEKKRKEKKEKMGLLDKLWDDTVAGPQPEHGLGKLRKVPAPLSLKDNEGDSSRMAMPMLLTTPTMPVSARKANVWRSVFHRGSNSSRGSMGNQVFDSPQPNSLTVNWMYSGDTRSKHHR